VVFLRILKFPGTGKVKNLAGLSWGINLTFGIGRGPFRNFLFREKGGII